MNPDFLDLLRAFIAADVRFMIVGAYALGAHGRPRATGDLDVWIEATTTNAPRVLRALQEFGAPISEISAGELAQPGVVFQIGLPPRRIDILTELTALSFQDAWDRRVRKPFGELPVDFIGREDFIRNKRATGRPRDLADIDDLEA
jgi:hypothetical protein